MPKPDELQATMTVDPTRLRLIRDRLQQEFYQTGPVSERVAAAVLSALKDLDKASLPH